MRNGKGLCRMVVLAVLVVSAVAGLWPGSGFAGEDMGEHEVTVWVETAAAQARSAELDCAQGLKCVEMCRRIGGVDHPQGIFDCR